MRDLHYDGLKHPLRGRVFEQDKMVDVKDIIVNNHNDIRFISADPNDVEFCIGDFMYFIVPKETLEVILEEVYQKGVTDGRKMKNKRQEEEPVITD